MGRVASRSGASRLPPPGGTPVPPAPGAYAIGLGSNRRHGRHGAPAEVLAAALTALGEAGVRVRRASPVVATPPLGPGGRRYANAAALVETALDPPALLALLKRIERDFGRRRSRRWGARVLDLDILLWSGGGWGTPTLRVPHPALPHRRFVLDPLAAIAGERRVAGAATVRHLRHRLTRPIPVHRGSGTVGL